MFSKRTAFTKTNWAVTLALLAVLVLSTVSPAFAAAKLRVGKVTIGSQAGTLTYGTGGSVTYSVVVTAATGQGSGIITLKIAGLPAGVSGVYNPATLSLTGGQSKSSVLTLTSDGSPLAGTFGFTVQAQGSNLKTAPGSLLIGKKTAKITANNLPKEYGTAYVFAGSEFTPNGFVSGDNVTSVTLSSAGAAAGATVAGSPYPIVPSAAVGSGLANYNIQYVAGNMTVTPRPLSVTGVVGINKVYDGLTTAAVDASGASLSGVLGSDVVNLNKGAATGAFLSPNVANASTIQVAGLTISGAAATNYSLVQPTTAANITPAAATITANPAFKIALGLDPTFTVSYNGFVNGETSAVVTTPPSCGVAGSHDAAGTYTITCSGAVAQNYTFSYVDGTLTVNASNALPTDITLSNNSVGERLAAGAVVGNLTTTDDDSAFGETYSYSLSTSGDCSGKGADNGSFNVSSLFSAGPVPLVTAAPLHYVTKSTYNICVAVDDGFGGHFGKAFVVNVLPSQLTLNSLNTADGYILQASPSSTVGGSMNSTANILVAGDDKFNKQYRSVMSFRTGILPDNATVLGVSIKIKKAALTNANLFTVLNGLRVDIIKPYYGDNLGLQLTDFMAATPSGSGLANACAFNPVPDVNGWYSTFPKCATALPAFINKVGPTQIRLHFSTFTNNNGVADYLSFYSGDAGPLNQPQLIITYSVP